MAKRPSVLGPLQFALLGSASLGLYLAVRLALGSAYNLPLVSPGSGVLLALFLAASWALVEGPVLAPGGLRRLAWAWAALACLAAGEAWLYAFVEFKDRLAPLGFALVSVGALFLLPSAGRVGRRWRALLLAAAVLLALLAAYAWWWPLQAGMDLVDGPVAGHGAPVLVWLLLLLSFLSLAVLAHRADSPAPLSARASWRREAWLLLGVLAIGASLRLPQMGTVPEGVWFDEVNLSRATEDRVLLSGQAPLYVGEQVENPGAYLWVGAAVFKLFGNGVLRYRYLAAVFGLLALIPFWALARLWFGGPWALVATLLFGSMRWMLIPERIAFMSGFALFWMLAAFWAFWSARLRGGAWRWALAGALAAANLYTYTPGRLVVVVLGAFIVVEAWKPSRIGQGGMSPAPTAKWGALGFAGVAAPILGFAAFHPDIFFRRAQQVSLLADAARHGASALSQLWISLSRHLLMLNFRGAANARHNLYFYPFVDFLTAAGLGVALPYAFGRALKDARGRFLVLWFVLMLCAGIFSIAVEAPQAHRTILLAPLLALALAWAGRDLLAPFGSSFVGGWPRSFKAVGLGLLLSVVAFNAYEVFGLWGPSNETWHSFSPFATAVARRAAQSAPTVDVRVSLLPNEQSFLGPERMAAAQYALRAQGRQLQSLNLGIVLPEQAHPSAVLLLWADSDVEVSAAFAKQFPQLTVEAPLNPHPASGEPSTLYLAAEVPWAAIPPLKGLAQPFLLARQ